MSRRFVVVASLLPVLLVSGAGAARGEEAPAALVKKVAAAYGELMRGVVAYRTEGESTVQATLLHRQTRSESWVILRDGRPVRTLVTRLVVDGREAPEKERQALEDKTNQAFEAGRHFFKAPYDPRYLADYTFKAAEGEGIAFASRARDENHGDGTLTLDAQGQLKRVRYTPCRMEGNAQGQMELAFGASPLGASPALSASRGEFKGSVGPLSGSMTLAQTLVRHQRFASLEAALERLGRKP